MKKRNHLYSYEIYQDLYDTWISRSPFGSTLNLLPDTGLRAVGLPYSQVTTGLGTPYARHWNVTDLPSTTFSFLGVVVKLGFAAENTRQISGNCFINYFSYPFVTMDCDDFNSKLDVLKTYRYFLTDWAFSSTGLSRLHNGSLIGIMK